MIVAPAAAPTSAMSLSIVIPPEGARADADRVAVLRRVDRGLDRCVAAVAAADAELGGRRLRHATAVAKQRRPARKTVFMAGTPPSSRITPVTAA